MKGLRLLLVFGFASLLLVEIYLKVFLGVGFQVYRLFVLIGLIATFSVNSKVTWCLGLLIFTYGVYYTFFVSPHASWYGATEFTSSLYYYILKHPKGIGRLFFAFPIIFYIVFLVLFLTKATRRHYGFVVA